MYTCSNNNDSSGSSSSKWGGEVSNRSRSRSSVRGEGEGAAAAGTHLAVDDVLAHAQQLLLPSALILLLRPPLPTAQV